MLQCIFVKYFLSGHVTKGKIISYVKCKYLWTSFIAENYGLFFCCCCLLFVFFSVLVLFLFFKLGVPKACELYQSSNTLNTKHFSFTKRKIPQSCLQAEFDFTVLYLRLFICSIYSEVLLKIKKKKNEKGCILEMKTNSYLNKITQTRSSLSCHIFTTFTIFQAPNKSSSN